jgi:fucose permease
MSMIYPTLNSRGIGCFPKTEHGAVAGVILFFTCATAAVGPLAMGVVSDIYAMPGTVLSWSPCPQRFFSRGCFMPFIYRRHAS